jgi:hypothetical protein
LLAWIFNVLDSTCKELVSKLKLNLEPSWGIRQQVSTGCYEFCVFQSYRCFHTLEDKIKFELIVKTSQERRRHVETDQTRNMTQESPIWNDHFLFSIYSSSCKDYQSQILYRKILETQIIHAKERKDSHMANVWFCVPFYLCYFSWIRFLFSSCLHLLAFIISFMHIYFKFPLNWMHLLFHVNLLLKVTSTLSN